MCAVGAAVMRMARMRPEIEISVSAPVPIVDRAIVPVVISAVIPRWIAIAIVGTVAAPIPITDAATISRGAAGQRKCRQPGEGDQDGSFHGSVSPLCPPLQCEKCCGLSIHRSARREGRTPSNRNE
jgi:hypothetical protein